MTNANCEVRHAEWDRILVTCKMTHETWYMWDDTWTNQWTKIHVTGTIWNDTWPMTVFEILHVKWGETNVTCEMTNDIHWWFAKDIQGGGEGGGDICYIPSYTFIYFYIPLYTFIYFQIPLYTLIYLQVPLYTLIYLHILKISNIRKMRSDIRPKNGLKWGPWGSPMARIWHVPSYHTPKGFSLPKGTQF